MHRILCHYVCLLIICEYIMCVVACDMLRSASMMDTNNNTKTKKSNSK